MSNVSPAPMQSTKAPAEFNPASLRLQSNVIADIDIKTEVSTVPVRRPPKQAFVRVHPGEGFTGDYMIVQLEGENEVYAVDVSMQAVLAGESKPVRLYVAMDSQRNVFLWPVPIPDAERPSDWHLSHHRAAQKARTDWVRLKTNRTLGCYVVQLPQGAGLPEPKWPDDLSFDDLIQKAFKGKVIDNEEHPVVKRLRGIAQ